MRPDALAAVPLPLRALALEMQSDASRFAERSSAAVGERLIVPLVSSAQFVTESAVLDLGGLAINCARVSPLIFRQELNHDATLLVKFSGDCHYKNGLTRRIIKAGEALLSGNDGGRHDCDYGSGIALKVDWSLLQRTISDLLDQPCHQPVERASVIHQGTATALFSFFAHVDELLLEERWLPKALGLGSQLYRYLAVALIKQNGQIDQLRRRQQERRRWSPGLDELVDQIRANRQQPFVMADLERMSCYSARHLTTLFRERFNCTPMQFVRRQRLELAMERLMAPQPGDTVIRIARECGYRHAANFSVDFQRQFNSKPSDVLRLSRGTRSL
jgi:AraC-like DNA-binding protein